MGTVVQGAVLLFLVSACGGGDTAGNESLGITTTPGSGTSFAFVTPVLNSTRVYAETITDNSNNTINVGFSQAVTAVNADGSVTELEQSTTGPSAIVNGNNYAIPTETENFNAQGQETSYVDSSDSPNVTCTFDPFASGPDWPLQVGQTWVTNYTLTCGTSAPVLYRQTGTVVDVESVTVPAGTFTAIKLQTTLTWTNSAGTTRVQTTTNWRDVATSHSIKASESVAVSGTAPSTGYAVARQIELDSIS